MAEKNRFYNAIRKVPFLAKAFDLLPRFQGINSPVDNIPKVENNAHRPNRFVLPLQLQRVKQDIATWRLAVEEAENAYYPHRFRMQQLFVDKVLEGHTLACMQRRKNLTLLKDFKFGTQNEEGVWVEDVERTKIFKNKKWFKDLLNNVLDAQFYGYSLIQLGDLYMVRKEYMFKDLTIIKRWHVSPDRYQLVQIPYQTWGLNFLDESQVDENGVSFADWLVYVPTPSDNGAAPCGYGLLYNVALYGIILRNNLSDNATFTELYAAPYRHIKTNEEYGSDEYNNLERSAQMMGSNGYLITGMKEEIEFITGNNGRGFESYADLEKRCQQHISKILLGHADALDSKSTALGGGTGGKKTIDEDNTPEGKALVEIEKTQDDFALNVLNDIIKQKLIKIGIPLSEDGCFYTTNDKEEFELRKKKDAANMITAEVWQIAKQGGLKLDAKTFTEITGIPCEEDDTIQPGGGGFQFGAHKQMSARMKKQLETMYKAHEHGKKG